MEDLDKELVYRIREYLQNNSQIGFVRTIGGRLGFDCDDDIYEDNIMKKYNTDFVIAPRKPLYTANELEGFMSSISKAYKPDKVIPFTDRESKLEFGKLLYYVDLGKIITTTVIESDSPRVRLFESFFACKSKKIVNEQSISSRITIRPFPSVRYADDVLNGNISEDSIYLEDLKKYY